MKYLIIRRNGLGDFISATIPLCNYIRNNDLSAEIVIFLSQRNAGVAKYFPGYRYFVIPNGNKYLTAIGMGFKARAWKVDVGIVPVPSSLNVNGVLLYVSGAKKRIGHLEVGGGILVYKPKKFCLP